MSKQAAEKKAAPDLAKEVREWVDLLARSHYEDLTYGPIFEHIPYKPKEKVEKLSATTKTSYVQKWQEEARAAGKNLIPIPPNNWRSKLKSSFAKYVDKDDAFEDWEETLAILLHRKREASAKVWHGRDIERRRRVVQKLPFHEIARQYPHLFRFQPSVFLIPEGENIEYWVDRIQKYIDLKAQKLKFRVDLSCYASTTVAGDQCLRLCRVHHVSESPVHIDLVSEEVNEVFAEAKLLKEEKVFDYRKHLQEMVRND